MPSIFTSVPFGGSRTAVYLRYSMAFLVLALLSTARAAPIGLVFESHLGFVMDKGSWTAKF